MSAKIFQLAPHAAQSDARDAAVKALSEGELVVLPTETVYGIAVRADSPAAVARLMAAKNRPESHPFTVAVADASEARKYVPQWGVMAGRLARRSLPGPITLVCDAGSPQSAIHALPAETKKYVAPENSVGLRVPAHAFTQDVLRAADFPVVLTSANLSGQADTISGADVIRALADRVDVIFDDGPSRYKMPSTVVRIAPETEEIRVLREGVCSRADIRQRCEMQILLLCTGNTCRSPLAEALAKKLLAQQTETIPETLREHGVYVHSAGTSVYESTPASIFGIQVAMRDYGMNMRAHRSRPVTPGMLQWADFVYVMTETHAQQALRMWPAVAPRLHVLAEKYGGVSDPFGGTLEVYQQTARQIYQELQREFAAPEFARELAVTLGAMKIL